MDPRRAARRWRHAGLASLELFRGALFPRATLERAARQAVYAQVEALATGRRALDLFCGRGRGAVQLLTAGASEVVGLASHRAAHSLARPGLTFHDGHQPPPDSGGNFDLVVCTRGQNVPETERESSIRYVAPGGQWVVAIPPDLSAIWRDLLRQHFLRVGSHRLIGSSIDGTDLRFEASDATPPASLESAETIYTILTASTPLRHLPPGPRRLHVGAGSQRLDGWINVDLRPFPGVDLVADVTRGLDLSDIDAVFAEHFLEHLAVDDALDFLTEVWHMLIGDGRLRLSTPNLDWVWKTHYRVKATAGAKVGAAVALNRAFHGWEHKFLWNRETLELALSVIGFRDLTWHAHGESNVEYLRDLERHETYDDDEDLRHVLIVEALKGTPDPKGLEALRERLQQDFLDHVAGY